eukprot:TRINITY_DN4118_c0_g2_i1.p1 TRINITY_DN4118_c0_g2~~TRINITY_DN4118_c0_g2_i1.p1  ORF type:complete len:571 (+),score=133.48 TRINITY_DN4118_c0_g2_i1:193-1713(+)
MASCLFHASLLALVLLLSCCVSGTPSPPGPPPDPVFDHQNVTYYPHLKPLSTRTEMNISTFFSPDTSLPTYMDLVAKATSSITVGTPGFSSWSGCTNWDVNSTNNGCNVYFQRNQEEFPLFVGLLNAVNKGLSVRILTNNYQQPPGYGLIDPLTFLSLAGAEIRYYRTTTFIHTKYLSIDEGKVATSISSVNLDFTSFMQNREAGVVFWGPTTVSDFYNDGFQSDWDIANPFKSNQYYNSSDMSIITDKSFIDIVMPEPVKFSGAYVSNVTNVAETMDITAFASPDFAAQTLLETVNATKSHLQVYIYQVTMGQECDVIERLHRSGVNITMLVSQTIFDPTDYGSAVQCYGQLDAAGVAIKVTAHYVYSYSHQKFWVVDDHYAFLSTGNWGVSDFPGDPQEYPPYGSSEWRSINRDWNVRVDGSDKFTGALTKVLDEDIQYAGDYSSGAIFCTGCDVPSGGPAAQQYSDMPYEAVDPAYIHAVLHRKERVDALDIGRRTVVRRSRA